MNLPFLKKYQPKKYNEFVIDEAYIQLLKTLIDMNNLNILWIRILKDIGLERIVTDFKQNLSK